jgi:hypothetical protein
MTTIGSVPAIYFGVWPRSEEGHHEHTPSGWRTWCVTPWSESTANLDGPVSALLAGMPVNSPTYLTATRDAPQHRWRTWHRSGVVQVGALVASGDWTLLAAWDRTGDPRNGSLSAFVLSGTLATAEAIVAARREFPIVWARIDRATMEGA